MGYSPWGSKELDITERLSTHAHVCVYVYKTNLFFALHGVTILISDDSYSNILKKIIANKIYHSL